MKRRLIILGLFLAFAGFASLWMLPQFSPNGETAGGGTAEPDMTPDKAEVMDEQAEAPAKKSDPDQQDSSKHAAHAAASSPRDRLSESVRQTVERLSSRDDTGLVEEPLPGGGTKVNLQGRFQSVPYATLDENGQITVAE